MKPKHPSKLEELFKTAQQRSAAGVGAAAEGTGAVEPAAPK